MNMARLPLLVAHSLGSERAGQPVLAAASWRGVDDQVTSGGLARRRLCENVYGSCLCARRRVLSASQAPRRRRLPTTNAHLDQHGGGAAAPEGRLKALLSSEEGQRYQNGVCSPTAAAISHPYGEAAHWAPFHVGYRTGAHSTLTLTPHRRGVNTWRFDGVVSHGLADEFYDATFFAASRVHDAVEGEPDHHDNFTASDVFAAASGSASPPTPTCRWARSCTSLARC